MPAAFVSRRNLILTYYLWGEKMQLLFFVLNCSEKLDDVLTSFSENDINGATILDSKGMAHILSSFQDEGGVPLFGAMRAFLNPDRLKSNLIIAALEDDCVKKAVKAIEDVIGDLSKPDTGVVFTVPISYVKGLFKDGD